MNRRKSLSEKEIRTILAIIECFREQNNYRWEKMNEHMGSITIDDMLKLNHKLDKWCNPEKYEEY